MTKTSFLLTVFLLAVPIAAMAQDSCDSILIPTNFREYKESHFAVAILKLIDSSNYQEARHKIGVNAIVPIDGIPVQFGEKYDDFDQQRQQVYQKDTLNLSDDEKHSVALTYLPDNVVAAWRACKEGHHAGFILTPRFQSDDELLVVASFDPNGPVDTKIKGITLNDGNRLAEGGPRKGDIWKNQSVHSFVIKREKSAALILTITLEGGWAGGTLALPKYSKAELFENSSCKSKDANGRCLRCEFDASDFAHIASEAGFTRYWCQNMPAGAQVDTNFQGDVHLDQYDDAQSWNLTLELSENGGPVSHQLQINSPGRSFNITTSVGHVPQDGNVIVELRNGHSVAAVNGGNPQPAVTASPGARVKVQVY